MTVNGVVLDIGYPAWMFERLPKEPEKKVRQRLRKRGLALEEAKTPRVSPLGKAWWLKRPKEHTESGPLLERAIGPVAYRGRTNYVRKKEPQALNDAAQGRKHLCKNGSSRGTPSAASAVDTSGQRLTRVQRLNGMFPHMSQQPGGWPAASNHLELADTVRRRAVKRRTLPTRLGDDCL